MKRFSDRNEAGRLLAKELSGRPGLRNGSLCVVALPRGGVPVGSEIAKALHAPLEVLVVRKLGVPWQPELAFGAIATGNVQIINDEVVEACALTETEIQAIVARELEELTRRERLYRDNRPPQDVHRRIVILVDDGIATGATMFAAVEALARKKPARLVVAVPVAPPDVCTMLAARVDEVVCLAQPRRLEAVGLWYTDFPQVSDEEVRTLMDEAKMLVQNR